MSASPLIPVDPSLIPDWVAVWQLARMRGDMRVLPEQEQGYFACFYAWPPASERMPEEHREQLERELGLRP